MSYLVLARKYRPQRFDEVVGQEHITRTLLNAISSGRLAHAILFAGPRGTGKTTVARILAKCVNCEAGPTTEPCNECRSCREITGSHAADVFEIDGASNNKVEHVRELRENARYLPAHSPYKIYIVDEVHMLSDAAFNALLKILEEPPGHVMFFFATTEPNKIPITIISRCQRHDFRRVGIDAIVAHMNSICENEGMTINTEGLSLIAREADGSVRDALSLLDHIMACAADNVGTSEILDVLGSIDRRELFAVSEAVFAADPATVLESIDQCYLRGQHMMKLFAEIVAHFRNLLVVKMGGGPETLADVPAHEIEEMGRQAEQVPATHLNQILDILFKEEATVKHSGQPKLALEMAFLRILQIKPALPLDTLIEKLDHLRSEVGTEKGNYRESETSFSQTPGTEQSRSRALSSEDSPEPDPEQVLQKPDQPRGGSLQDTEEPKRQTRQGAGAAGSAADARPARKAPESPEEKWQAILERLAGQQPSLAACLAQSRLASVEDSQISIELPAGQFHMNWVKREKNQSVLRQMCSEQFGREMQLCFLEPENAAEDCTRTEKKEAERLKQEALRHPMVEEAMKLFQGQIIDVKIL
ncbi:MAG: DNA polymerase III subunit gamma/tau [Desulfosalsimonadaceae bacterium]